MTLGDRMAQWPEKYREEGRREGAAQSAARGRAIIRRMAVVRFGDGVGEQIEALLANTDDWDPISTVAELVVTAKSGTDLLDDTAAILHPPEQSTRVGP